MTGNGNGSAPQKTGRGSPPPPWQLQPGETPESFSNFIIFRDLPVRQRSFAEVSRQTGLSQDWIGKMAARFGWKERALSWDEEKDRYHRQGQLALIESMSQRHSQLAGAMTALAAKRLTKLGKLSEEELAKVMSSGDVVRFIEAAVKIERIALGAPTEIVAGSNPDTIRASERGTARAAAERLSSDPRALAAALDLERALAAAPVGGSGSALEGSSSAELEQPPNGNGSAA